MSRRVVITGMGAVTPLGVGARVLYERWVAGSCAIEEGVGRCSDFDPSEFMSRKEQRRTDRFTQLSLAACAEAVDDAGWEPEAPYAPDRVACVMGTGVGGIGTIESQHRVLLDRGGASLSPLAVALMMPNANAAVLAMRHGFMGPNHGVTSACAGGAHALGTALRMVQSGDADAAVAGGAEAGLTEMTRASFAVMGATSPTGVSRPFDARRDGFVLSEGAGVLVLEEREAALARGARVLGELLGYGATTDAFHLTAPAPGGAGAARAISLALADAHVAPEEVDYVNAHGTSTVLNDRAETAALKAALGPVAGERPVSSLKSAIGHLLGGAGAVEAIATVYALSERTAPPTLGWEVPDEGLDLDYVPGFARPIGTANGRAVGISDSFGFGGHNAVLCLAA